MLFAPNATFAVIVYAVNTRETGTKAFVHRQGRIKIRLAVAGGHGYNGRASFGYTAVFVDCRS